MISLIKKLQSLLFNKGYFCCVWFVISVMSQCLNAQVATPANTTLMAEARAAYTVEIDGEIVVISVRAPLSSNSVVIQRIVEVYDPLVTPNSLLGEDNNLHFAFPGDQVLIPFTLQNGGNIADRYRLNFSSPSGDYNAAILGFHVDTNSNGILDPGEAPIGNVSPLLQQGETVSLLVNIQIPTTTQNGDSADFLLEAESITSPTAFDNQNYARVEVNANQSVFLNLTSDMSVVEPGDKVTFDLDLINRSTATLGRSSFVIDSTSGVLGYLMSFPIDAALTVDPNSVATTESSGAVVVYFEDALTGWTTTYQGGTLEAVGLFYFNDITPAQSIDLSWCATVDSTLTQRLDLRNRAIFSFDSVMVESNENPLTVEERPFLLAVAAVSDIHIGPDGAPRAAAANDQSTSPPTTIPSTGDTTYLRGATYVFDLAIENDSSFQIF